MNAKLAWAIILAGIATHNHVAHAKIVFTELMIHPGKATTTDPSTQWFELYNTENSTVVLNNYMLEARVSGGPIDAVVISPPGTLVIGPYGYVVIGNNGNVASNGGVVVNFQLAFETTFPKDGSGLNQLKIYPPMSTLFDDAVTWNTMDRSSPALNFTFTPGASLAKISAIVTSDHNGASNWKPSTSLINCKSGADKGTPGKINAFVCPTVPVKAPVKPPLVAPMTVPVVVVAPIPAAPAPMGPAPSSSSKCGLFQLGIICLNGCGILGRTLGICSN